MHSIVAASLLAGLSWAQSSCPTSVASSVPMPSVAPGYVARLVASGLTSPRGMVFDSEDKLLVVEEGVGVTALTLDDAGGPCVTVASRDSVIEMDSLNHGIAIEPDDSALYASSADAVMRFPYKSVSIAVSPQQGTLISNMTTSDHTTRTLVLSRKVPGMLIVNRGSTSNIDPLAQDLATGHSQVKAFNITGLDRVLDFNADGVRLAWGVRNEVGIDEDPASGAVYGVENSVDNMMRDGQDVHENNPGEELNFFGFLNDTTGDNMGTNFGYPECFSAWDPSTIPQNDNIEVGTQFAIDDSGVDDSFCMNNRTQSRLVFTPHMAPLDIKFSSAGMNAWIAFHGSWDRSDPSGYLVGRVAFSNGQPTEPVTSNTALIPIVSNTDNSQCPENCFRPVAMAWDSKGRLFFSSDSTGEVYVVTLEDGKGVNDGANASLPTPTGSDGMGGQTPAAGGAEPASTTGAAALEVVGRWVLPGVVAVAAFLV